jgi:hypothetical protein
MNIGKAIRLLKVEPIQIPIPRKSRKRETAVTPPGDREMQTTARR